MARSLEAALLAASVVIAGCSEAAPAPQPAVQPAPADATPPIGDRVAAALRQAAEEGTHWHRTDSVVELGRDAVPLLRTTLVDAGRESAARVLAVQSLGRIGGPDAASALHAVLAQDGVEPEVRKAAENGLFLLGEPDLVERRIESARARHADIAIARAGAEAEVAQTLYATGRFAQAAAAWRALLATSVDVDRDVDRAGRLAYDWACCAALAGAPDEALDAIAVAVKSQRTDLDWMARDGDLRTVQGDPRFAKLLADARAARTAAPARPPDAARDVPGYEVGMSAPDVEAKDLRGAAVSLRALRGSVVVLDFWATWCGPCIGEVPHMIELHRRFQGEGLALVGVSLDEDGLALADFLAERDMPWPEICDLGGFDGALPKLFHVRGIPDTVLVGRDGRILARGLRGEDLEKAVEKALAAGR